MNKKLFHKAFYSFMRCLVAPYFATFGHYSWKVYKPKSDTYLVLTNHNTNWDFFLFGMTFRKHMYFVASEHIFRQGVASWFIKNLGDPIPRRKGAASDDTVKLILQRLHEGSNVCMMAEGNRSFSGETGFISPKTAELAKNSGAGLITYRIHGGYFINPRWSSEPRKGKCSGEVVNEYTPEQLREMSVEEVYDAICRDLYVNAYEDQALSPAKYFCLHPAEHLETALFACPECKSFSTLHSKDDKFCCAECGMELRLNEYGYFEDTRGGKPPFNTILEWDKWQQRYLHEYLPTVSDPDIPFFSDAGIHISAVTPGVGTEKLAEGRMVMYCDRIEIGDFKLMLRDIEKISITLVDTLLLTAAGKYYEIKGTHHYSALKYLISSRLLMGKEYK